jgi:hypothetical protein
MYRSMFEGVVPAGWVVQRCEAHFKRTDFTNLE